MAGIRNRKTTHPKKSARRVRALDRLAQTTKGGASNDGVRIALTGRIGKPPRSWPDPKAGRK